MAEALGEGRVRVIFHAQDSHMRFSVSGFGYGVSGMGFEGEGLGCEVDEGEYVQTLQGYLAHKKCPPSPQDHLRALGMVLM